MLSVDDWEAIATVCGALVGLAAVAEIARRVVRRMFQVLKQAAIFLRQVNGGPNQPTMMDVLHEIKSTNQANSVRLTSIEKWQADHMEQGHPTAGPIAVPFQRGRRKT